METLDFGLKDARYAIDGRWPVPSSLSTRSDRRERVFDESADGGHPVLPPVEIRLYACFDSRMKRVELMDRDEGLRLLRGGPDGIEEWNRRRKSGESVPNLGAIDLTGAMLMKANLSRADLHGAMLTEADLTGADLAGANLNGANLNRADLTRADLNSADLTSAVLLGAILIHADLSGANLTLADLFLAVLHGADLREARFVGANMTRAVLISADLREAIFGMTIFANLNLAESIGTDSCMHLYPSTIGTDTLSLSGGKIPEAFLRGCGLSPWEILAANFYRHEVTPAGLADLQYQVFDTLLSGVVARGN